VSAIEHSSPIKEKSESFGSRRSMQPLHVNISNRYKCW